MQLHRFLFTATLTCTSRVVQIRDRLLGRIPRTRLECAGIAVAKRLIPSGKNQLDAVFVRPSNTLPQAAVLICHGIGEVVSQWFPIQRIFAENGIASLVFDYSGYGRSTGFIDSTQCEQDAIAAFEVLRHLAPAIPISLLGFSLGTGVAPAILDRVEADRLVLCGGYSSFRKAARAAWIPGFLSPLVPPIWSAADALRDCCLPILIVQGDRDRLFPMQMGHDLSLAAAARPSCLSSRRAPTTHPSTSPKWPTGAPSSPGFSGARSRHEQPANFADSLTARQPANPASPATPRSFRYT